MALQLREQGIKDAYALTGGYEAWVEAGQSTDSMGGPAGLGQQLPP